MREFVVGTRNSKLALIQTRKMIYRLRESGVKKPIRIKEIVTEGDKRLDVPLQALDSGIFLQGIETELANGEIDFAVHSLKDVPPVLPDGLQISAVPEREDVRDAYLANGHVAFQALPEGAVIGTCSVRRAAQLRRMRPDIQTKSVRGPIDSRIKQMQEGNYDAIVLAVSGIKRLGTGLDVITEYLPAETFVPAIGQAALAIESRADDTEMNQLLKQINDPASEKAVQTERTFLKFYTEQEAVAGYATVEEGVITFHAIVISLDGKEMVEHTVKGCEPDAVSAEMYHALSAKGADALIEQMKVELGKA